MEQLTAIIISIIVGILLGMIAHKTKYLWWVIVAYILGVAQVSILWYLLG